MIAPHIREKIKRIKLFIVDIDGVLTDGRIVYDNRGNELKFFDVQDGFGITLLRRAGIECAIMTAKKTRIVAKRARDIKASFLFQNCTDKLKTFQTLLDKVDVHPEEICYIGDDLIDIPVLKRVGFAVSVPNAVPEAREIAHYITHKRGGRGAVREICDLIIKTQGKWDNILARYNR
jgi:3-deoxy-D-manno-octulosonate 8-phosphate phosphatase (KDO 8-P phosphatase)